MTTKDTNKATAKPVRRMARELNGGAAAEPPPKRPNKSAAVLAMLQCPAGATLDQIVIATGWLPHTARAALTGLKKKGHKIISDKQAGCVRTYCLDVEIQAAP